MGDVAKAAHRKGLDKQQTLFEIERYPERNAADHIGIGRMLDICEWTALAERILYDKATLATVFAKEQGEGPMM